MIPGSANPLLLKSAAAAAGGLQIQRSLRFNSSDSGYLSRVPAVAGNQKKWSYSIWVKRSTITESYASPLLSTDYATGGNRGVDFRFSSNDELNFAGYNSSGGNLFSVVTTQVFRDVSAWYNFVISVDTDQVAPSDRVRMYVNGTQITSFSTATYPVQGDSLELNSTEGHYIGCLYLNGTAQRFFNGYLANIHLIDGQQLTPSSFTETDATTGQLIPKTYSGSYGTNGFNLLFADNSSNTASTLGKDTSGLSNNWTPNNLSVTAGAGNDSLIDSPTNYGTDTGVGGEVRGNYCTLNPLDNGGLTLSDGNLNATTSSAGDLTVRGTVGVSSGKWYWEITATNLVASSGDKRSTIGISLLNTTLPSFVGSNATSWAYINHNGQKTTNNAAQSYGASWATGDVIGVAFDADAGSLTFYKNGVSQGIAYSGLASNVYTPAINLAASGAAEAANFGQRAFAYTAPSGFKALCTQNLPAPLVTKSNTVFDVVTYTGNGSTQTLPNASSTPTSLAFSPDFVWVKQRDSTNTASHVLVDIVRGNNNVLRTNGTEAENAADINPAVYDGITNLSTASFDVVKGSSGTYNGTNGSGKSYVAWAWDAGTSTVSNTQGSITSQVRANATAGFSVISYTGNGSGGSTIGHGLGVAPAFAIFKNRSTSSDWQVYHVSLGNANSILLQSTAAAGGSSAFNSTSPTSTVITLGAGTSLNNNGSNHICYAFSPVVGYSNGFSYTGNGSADGSFVYLGFRPRLIMLKRSDSTSNWTLLDTSREGYNVDNDPLYPNTSAAEGTADLVDITSNGFKLRTTDASVNASAGTYIGFAWAEMPFNYSRAR
jgi:hypothetical protein